MKGRYAFFLKVRKDPEEVFHVCVVLTAAQIVNLKCSGILITATRRARLLSAWLRSSSLPRTHVAGRLTRGPFFPDSQLIQDALPPP